MLPIEDYIARRKREDKLNEYDFDKRVENIKACVDYIFEYFNGYLGINEAEHKMILGDERIESYRNKLRSYSKDVQEWLTGIYRDYDKQIHRSISQVINENELFYLYCTDSEFRSVSYEIYSRLIKKLPFLRDQTEMLFIFAKDYHRKNSIIDAGLKNKPFFSQAISEWLELTQSRYQVNIITFIEAYLLRFSDNPDTWPKSHRIRNRDSNLPDEYDYKQKKNLFNLDAVYPKLSKKPFIKNHRQELEFLMMHFWTNSIVGDKKYWEEYSAKVLPSLMDEG